MDKLKFYEISEEYICFLKQFDHKIPDTAYKAHNKFMCGVVLEVNGLNYFAPVSSFKIQQSTNIVIENEKGEEVGSIRFSFMFPAPDSELRIKDFDLENPKYRRLLLEELKFCNKNYEQIISKARYVYKRVVSGRYDKMANNCCNYILLEQKYKEYKDKQGK